MSSSKYSVLIFPNAENDIQEMKTYFQEVLKTSARPLLEKFLVQLDLLEQNPFIFPVSKDPYLQQLGYRVIPMDNYLIFYIIKEKEVQIHRFLYGRRNYQILF